MCQLTELGTLANPLPLMFVQDSIIHFGTHASKLYVHYVRHPVLRPGL